MSKRTKVRSRPKRSAVVSNPQGERRPLPMTRQEMKGLWAWDTLDVLLVSGDAYIDHPAFGAALLGRFLVQHGYRVGIVAQPRWDSIEDLNRMGRPRLFVGLAAGALDSMLAHYTAFRRRRRDDAYTPGGHTGARPNRASLVYTGLARQAFPGLPVILGGIEASLRRASHYDFWSDKLRRSLLLDSKADLLIYGMAERALLQVAHRLDHEVGEAFAGKKGDRKNLRKAYRAILQGIDGTAFVGSAPKDVEVITLPSHEQICEDPTQLLQATLSLEQQIHHGRLWATQRCGERTVVFAPPAAPLSQHELDALYDLPFTREPHPSYGEASIPAMEMIRFSITSHRGCGGGCSFCSLALHQGRRVTSRSGQSIRSEVMTMIHHPKWRGSIADVGGASANLWGARCKSDRLCKQKSCLFPKPCKELEVSQQKLARLLRSLKKIQGVKHVRVASGVRHDLALQDQEYLEALIDELTGGQLKLAPEHCVGRVLQLMRKPSFESFESFLAIFSERSRQIDKKQYIVPYLMSAFPGCTDEDMSQLAAWLAKKGWKPQQVQCFVPTPGTVATAMFYAGVDPRGRPIYIARTDAQRLRQHRLLQGRFSRL